MPCPAPPRSRLGPRPWSRPGWLLGLALTLALGHPRPARAFGGLIKACASAGRLAGQAGRLGKAAGTVAKGGRALRAGKAALLVGGASEAGTVAARAARALAALPLDEAGRGAVYLDRAGAGLLQLVTADGAVHAVERAALGGTLLGARSGPGLRVVLSPAAALELAEAPLGLPRGTVLLLDDPAGALRPLAAAAPPARAPAPAASPAELVSHTLDAAELAQLLLAPLGQPDPAAPPEARPLQTAFTGTATTCLVPPPGPFVDDAVTPGPAGLHRWLAGPTGALVLAVVGTAAEARALAASAAQGRTDLVAVHLSDPCDPAALAPLHARVTAALAAGALLPLADGLAGAAGAPVLGAPALDSVAPLQARALAVPSSGAGAVAGLQGVHWVRQVTAPAAVAGPPDPATEPPVWVTGLGLVLGLAVAAGFALRAHLKS